MDLYTCRGGRVKISPLHQISGRHADLVIRLVGVESPELKRSLVTQSEQDDVRS